jgi:uncharacterized membrane protein (UPF0127 family)
MTWPSPRTLAVLAATSTSVLLAGCGSAVDTPNGAGRPAESSPPGPSTTAIPGTGRQPEGFTTIRAQVTDADGEVCEICLWLADDGDERRRGLMGVTDLGDAAGMAFRFDEPTSSTFWMFDTPTPLSIAWFAPDGHQVGSADMSPCIDTESSACPSYSPGSDYDLAIEVFAGGLEGLGLGPGSRVELLDGTESERCPATP